MKIRVIFKKLFRMILMLFFKFDFWHTSPLENRKYAIDIISKLNCRVSRDSIIEIGCGLGDILAKTHYTKKYFYDRSPEVLGAAAFLQRFSKISSINSFKTFNLLTDNLEKGLKFDAIIMVNWLHGFESESLKNRLNKIVNENLNEKGVIVFDIIENNQSYKFNHTAIELIDLQKFDITTFDEYPFGRRLIFAELK